MCTDNIYFIVSVRVLPDRRELRKKKKYPIENKNNEMSTDRHTCIPFPICTWQDNNFSTFSYDQTEVLINKLSK